MKVRYLLAALALTTAATDSEAGPLRRRAQPVYQPVYRPAYQPYASGPVVTTPTAPGGEYVSNYTPTVTTSSGVVINSTSVVTAGYTATTVDQTGLSAGDGLDEVNAKRMARGLRPYVRDDGLTAAARACAAFRAQHGLFGHTGNDFAFLPAGSFAATAGCAAYPASYGWMSCCIYENYTYAGAAWVTGADGRRYMHLFLR
jgi:hypothetical protein